MIDKDLKEDAAISEAFPNAIILYCFWHDIEEDKDDCGDISCSQSSKRSDFSYFDLT